MSQEDPGANGKELSLAQFGIWLKKNCDNSGILKHLLSKAAWAHTTPREVNTQRQMLLPFEAMVTRLLILEFSNQCSKGNILVYIGP